MDHNDRAASFRVAEALAKDVGRGIVRIDPDQIDALGASIGSVVEVAGKRATVAKVMPNYPTQRGQGIIQMDGIVRENAGTSLDERIRVRPTSFQLARSLELSPLEGSRTLPRGQERYIARLLEGLAVTEGDRVRVKLLGARTLDFAVTGGNPKGAVLIQPSTAVSIRGSAPSADKGLKVSYEDVGGLGREVARIREMIELPLRFPEVFERLGIEPPKGVLLYGPPGCGKTLIARAVAHETSAYFIHINGPEVIHKFYGESEAHLRTIFGEAEAHAPSIVFLDEIDAIAQKREEMHGEVEKRVVAQLLALMDGLKSRGQVIVIGATNIPNSLDPALRRPGRFDREIAIGIPDRNGRLEILEIHTQGMPLASDVDLERIAGITHGFVGADLQALTREAAMHTLRELMPNIDFAQASIPYERLMELEVSMASFMEALKEVEPSAIREVFTEVPDVRWEHVGGLAEAKRTLRETIEWPLRYTPLFKHAHTAPPRGILLYGAPGTGKTLIAKAVATESQANFISVKGPALLSQWVGESEKGVREVFRKARQASPCIVFFDEIDALVPARGVGGSDSHVTERVVSQFLTELDGIEELRGVVVIGATNRPDILDPALLRPGRFDVALELPMPDGNARLEILRVHVSGKPMAADVGLDELVAATAGMAGSDLEGIVRRASMLAIREFVEAHPKADDYGDFTIHGRHLLDALAEIRAERRRLGTESGGREER